MNLCSCHGQPLTWCPRHKGRPVVDILTLQHPAQGTGALPPIGPDDVPHRGTAFLDGTYVCDRDCPGWHAGTVVQVDRGGNCGICGDTYFPGEQVVKLPLPAYGFPYSHAICEPSPS